MFSAGSQELVWFLVDYGADKERATEDTGDYPVHLAARQGHLEVLRYLLQQGACVDVNSGARRSETK